MACSGNLVESFWRSGWTLALCFHVASKSNACFMVCKVVAVVLYAFCQYACPHGFFCALFLMWVATCAFTLCSSIVLERREQYDWNQAVWRALVEGFGLLSSMRREGSMAEAMSVDHSVLCCF